VITGIVVALSEELTTLTPKKIDKGDCLFVADKLVVAYSGSGSINARSAAELLVTKGATRLISWGCAAALSGTLKPGDLVLADELIDFEGGRDAKCCVSTDWHSYTKERLATFLAVHCGRLAESTSIVSNRMEKKQLYALTGAVALDMESVAIAKVARQYTIPFLVIRAIVDPVDMSLPQAISYSLNDQGEVALGKLLFFLFLHPAELPGLIKLGMYFNAAKKTLKLVAKHLDTVTGVNCSNAATF